MCVSGTVRLHLKLVPRVKQSVPGNLMNEVGGPFTFPFFFSFLNQSINIQVELCDIVCLAESWKKLSPEQLLKGNQAALASAVKASSSISFFCPRLMFLYHLTSPSFARFVATEFFAVLT